MKNLFLVIFCIVGILQPACGQNNPVSNSTERQTSDKRKENLKQQAREFYQAKIDSDIQTVSKFIYYPRIVQESAEKEKEYRERNAKNHTQDNEILKETGTLIKIKQVNEPSEFVEEYNQLISIVTIDTVWVTKDGECEITVCIVGLSHNKGENWEFFNGSCSDDTFPKRFGFYFSEAAKKLTFPKRETPKCVEK